MSLGVDQHPLTGGNRLCFPACCVKIDRVPVVELEGNAQMYMQEEAEKTVPLEVQQHVKHYKRGILSMGRMDDPDSGQSSFSILLGPAPHLDMHYTIWGYGKASQQTPKRLPEEQ